MFKIFNENYYIDLDAIDNYVQIDEEEDKVLSKKNDEDSVIELESETKIHLVKYELVKTMLETILTESNEVDEDLGMKSNEVSIPFKISFNSLIMKNIINKI
jgi:hypothetical protein